MYSTTDLLYLTFITFITGSTIARKVELFMMAVFSVRLIFLVTSMLQVRAPRRFYIGQHLLSLVAYKFLLQSPVS